MFASHIQPYMNDFFFYLLGSRVTKSAQRLVEASGNVKFDVVNTIS